MNESAEESDLACFNSPSGTLVGAWQGTARRYIPKITLQQLSTQIILSLGARYDLIFSSSAVIVSIEPATSSTSYLPCCASLRNLLPLSLLSGMSRCASRIHP